MIIYLENVRYFDLLKKVNNLSYYFAIENLILNSNHISNYAKLYFDFTLVIY